MSFRDDDDLPPPLIPKIFCSFCGVQKPKCKLCSRCRITVYCDEQCQRNDWTEGGHKGECRAFNALDEEIKTLRLDLFGGTEGAVSTRQTTFDEFFEEANCYISQELYENKKLQSLWLKGMVKYDGDINQRDAFGYSLLHHAAEFDNSIMVRLLAKRGADLELQSGMGPAGSTRCTPLIKACAHSSFDAAITLVEVGANINARTAGQTTALLIAKPTVSCLELMKALGFDLHAEDESGAGLPTRIIKAFLTAQPAGIPQSIRITRPEMLASLDWCRANGIDIPPHIERCAEQTGDIDGVPFPFPDGVPDCNQM